ncbi:hypothetical protein L2E82_10348 [Cichorium intybus]|uniref:Uncharacterized protein n=1 Tax=Cichorium intybus TaxID=13427 RepID=A0ACB9GA67_CICIN|nr:hypothetical protein L2E82_10348 [Cichorium intybus]
MGQSRHPCAIVEVQMVLPPIRTAVADGWSDHVGVRRRVRTHQFHDSYVGFEWVRIRRKEREGNEIQTENLTVYDALVAEEGGESSGRCEDADGLGFCLLRERCVG